MDASMRTQNWTTLQFDATRILIALFLLIAVCAFAPRLLINDHTSTDVTDAQVRALRAEATSSSVATPLFQLQVIEARPTGPHPPDVAGVITWRTLFGIPVGESRHADGGATFDVPYGAAFAVWSMFLLAEGAIAGFALRRIWLGI